MIDPKAEDVGREVRWSDGGRPPKTDRGVLQGFALTSTGRAPMMVPVRYREGVLLTPRADLGWVSASPPPNPINP